MYKFSGDMCTGSPAHQATSDPSGCETIEYSPKSNQRGENVRFWHFRLPRKIYSQNN